MPQQHIVRSFDEELAALNRAIVQMGGIAEAQVEAALRVVSRRDTNYAVEVMRADSRLDDLDHEVNADVVSLLARRQPVADDLRNIVASLRISSDLERIGDLAANIAKRSIALSQAPVIRPTRGVQMLGRVVQEMIKDILDAYGERDVSKAIDTWRRDEEIDDHYNSLFREVLTYMMEDPRMITPCTHLLFIAKNLERIGDHTTNIAENISFMVEGVHLRERRNKGQGHGTPDDGSLDVDTLSASLMPTDDSER